MADEELRSLERSSLIGDAQATTKLCNLKRRLGIMFKGMEDFEGFQKITGDMTDQFSIRHTDHWGHFVTCTCYLSDDRTSYFIIFVNKTKDGVFELRLETSKTGDDKKAVTVQHKLDETKLDDTDATIRIRAKISNLVEGLKVVARPAVEGPMVVK